MPHAEVSRSGLDMLATLAGPKFLLGVKKVAARTAA
jgi:hypothetical protein